MHQPSSRISCAVNEQQREMHNHKNNPHSRCREREKERGTEKALAILNALWLSRERSRDYPNSSRYQCALLFFNLIGLGAVSNNPTNVSINAVVDLFGIFTRNELQRLTTVITREFQLHGEKRTVIRLSCIQSKEWQNIPKVI